MTTSLEGRDRAADPTLRTATRRRLVAAALALMVGLWFAVITWPETPGVYVWLAAPLLLCVLAVSAGRRGAKAEGWVYLGALAVLTLLSLASFGLFLTPSLLLLLAAQSAGPSHGRSQR